MSETANGNGEPPLQSASAGGAEQGAKEPFRYIYLPLASGQIPDEVNLNHYWNALKRRKFRTFIGGSDGPSAYLGSEEEALAILNSRKFSTDYLAQKELLMVLFADRWDAKREQWISTFWRRRAPTMWDAFRMWDSKIRKINADQSAGTLVMTVSWKDAKLASAWANELVARLNDHMRERVVTRAEKSLDYLREELTKTSIAELRLSLYTAMEQQMRAIMTANVVKEYSFTVIDPAVPPEQQRLTMVRRLILSVLAMGAALGAAVLIVLLTERLASPPSLPAEAES